MNTVEYIIKKNNEITIVSFDADTEIAPHAFLTEDEIIYDIVTHRLNDEKTRNEICNTSEENLFQFHFDFGMWVRNSYGLWQPNNPIVGDKHPDDLSMELIKLVVKTLNGEYEPQVNLTSHNYDRAMKVLGDT